MDVKNLASFIGVNVDSIVGYKPSESGATVTVDLSKESQLRKALETRGNAQVRLPDGDTFTTEFVVDGENRQFLPTYISKRRNDKLWEGGSWEPIPGWILRAETYFPQSTFGAAVEYIGFFVLDRHSGTDHELIVVDDPTIVRPYVSYALGRTFGETRLIFQVGWATAGRYKPQHDLDGENSMTMVGTFSDVQIIMPNCHEYFEQAPDREFPVLLPSGSYNLSGSW